MPKRPELKPEPPICPACAAHASKAVISCRKPRHPALRLFQRYRWTGLPLLGAEDHRMDVAAWLRGLGLKQYALAFRKNDSKHAGAAIG
jgi:hypothetical protein